jgi:isoamylase
VVNGLKAGQLYGYKVRGEYRPEWGFRFNEAKLMLDPYAKAVTGKFRNVDNLLLAYDPQPGADERLPDSRDNTTIVSKAIVVDDAFDWQGVAAPELALEQLIIYEVHVKGFTAHPAAGVGSPGTYLGFIEKIPHLKRLGINAVEFLPVHEFYVDDFLAQKGLTNYWGYNSIGFFTPESSYSTRRTPAARSPSSRPWCGSCTGRGSRSFSTWFTTTPARGMRWVRPCAFGGWTMPLIIV